ncbi:hypothetical protein AB3X93_04400, partial [Paraburkholderia sp. BR14262]|uniref:hypothetical protein n=1 Tax=Paraburkholderia sp. BR14262 TaxID=3236999 RepID=UPI0034CE97DF
SGAHRHAYATRLARVGADSTALSLISLRAHIFQYPSVRTRGVVKFRKFKLTRAASADGRKATDLMSGQSAI